jgi:adenylate cyclase
LESQRSLAAIMYTDIVGYTSATQKNEQLELELLEEHRKLLRPFFTKHNGREIKTMGDAFLVEFASALEAARCAFDMQQSLHELNSNRPPERQVVLRIGLHLGDVVHSASDIYGDTVNVASRIEPFAEPGGICISEQIYQQLRNKFEFPIIKIGTKRLKNVDAPMQVYRVVLPWESEISTAQTSKRRIAILPFTNISPDPKDEYFADGLTEEMIHVLSQIRRLEVIARTSVMCYKGGEKQVQTIGRELNVGSLLEGSVRKAGNKVRVTAQLIDAESEAHVWSERYDRDLDDIFAIQSEIAKHVADALEVELVKNEEERVNKKPTDYVEAFNLYLKGRQLLNDWSPAAIQEAKECFELAIAKDPEFARAYSGIADCYSSWLNMGVMPGSRAIPVARDYLNKALELDHELAEAHSSLGFALDLSFDPTAAESELKLAMLLNPSYAWTYMVYSYSLAGSGRLTEALEEMKKARNADPLSPFILVMSAIGYLAAGMDEDSWKEFDEAMKVNPEYWLLYFIRAWYFLRRSKLNEAKKDLEKSLALSKYLHVKGWLGYVCAVRGEVAEAKGILDELTKLQKERYVGAEAFAYVYAGLNERDKFFECLERAIDEKTVDRFSLLYAPVYDSFRADKRYVELVRKANVTI